jgi:hypothetical protein
VLTRGATGSSGVGSRIGFGYVNYRLGELVGVPRRFGSYPLAYFPGIDVQSIKNAGLNWFTGFNNGVGSRSNTTHVISMFSGYHNQTDPLPSRPTRFDWNPTAQGDGSSGMAALSDPIRRSFARCV